MRLRAAFGPPDSRSSTLRACDWQTHRVDVGNAMTLAVEAVGGPAWWGFCLAIAATEAALQTLNALGKTEFDFWPLSVDDPKATALAAWYTFVTMFALVGLILSL
jgi:hypothetical protein